MNTHINVKELKIGNYLSRYFIHKNDNGEIVKLDMDKLVSIYEDTSKFKYKYILLSEDILIKLGFLEINRFNKYKQYEKDLGYPHKNIMIRIIDNNNVSIFNQSECDGQYQFITKLNYLHELQNLCFLITKEELTIK